jgi:hypothetical protein
MDARALLQVLQVAGNATLAAPNPEEYPVSRDGIQRLRQDFRAWHAEHRLPAIRSLNRAWTALCEGPHPPRPPITVHVNCPDATLHTASPRWNPAARAVHLRRPAVQMTTQVVVALRAARASARAR